MPKKVLILASTFPRWSGDQTPSFIYDLVKQLSKGSHFSYEVLVPHAAGAKRKEAINKRFKVRRLVYALPPSSQKIFYDGGAANKRRDIWFKLQAVSYLVRLFFATLSRAVFGRVAIINAHWLIPQGLIAVLVGKLTGTPVVVTIHGGDIFTLNSGFARRLKRFTLKQATTVFVNSSVVEKACRDIYNRPYEFGPMGVAVEKFEARPRVRDSGSRKKPTILFVGRAVREKGIEYLIDAMKEVDAELIIVGDGPNLPHLQKLAQKKPYAQKIRFLGWVGHDLLADIYSKADLFVGPSITLENGWREAMGLVYLEAMFSGLPVVTTDSTGAQDFVRPGCNGLVVPEKNAAKLADAINSLLSSPPPRADFNAELRSLKQRYSQPVCADRYQQIFSRISKQLQ